MLLCLACVESVKLTGNEFLIEGVILDIEDETVIALVRFDGNTGRSIAMDTIRNGRFTFKNEAESNPELLLIIPVSEGFSTMMLNVWVAPRSKIRIKGKGTLHPVWEVKLCRERVWNGCHTPTVYYMGVVLPQPLYRRRLQTGVCC